MTLSFRRIQDPPSLGESRSVQPDIPRYRQLQNDILRINDFLNMMPASVVENRQAGVYRENVKADRRNGHTEVSKQLLKAVREGD